MEVEWQGAATDETALVFPHKLCSPVATLKQLDGKTFFEVDVAGLPTRQLTEGDPCDGRALPDPPPG